jgi:predicted DNA-binding transcriptional regulator YafY
MGKGKTKDRTARWANIEHLLYQNRSGLTVKELADKCYVSTRQIYRDFHDLEQKLSIGFWQDGNKWGIPDGYFLPPIRFSLPEALNIFLAARLMVSYSRHYDVNIASTFTKLNSIVPSPLREQIQKTIDWMQALPADEKHLRILAKLAEAWASQCQVKLTYQSLPAEKATERIIEPYFIEPAAPCHSSYVVAYCHRAGEVRVFKLERIEDIELIQQTYNIPSDFDANKFFASAWGIVVGDEVKTVKLKFHPEIARLIEETIWHPSQMVERKRNGSVIMTLKVFDTYEFRSWILQWGEKVEVVEPEELRQAIAHTGSAIAELYQELLSNPVEIPLPA